MVFFITSLQFKSLFVSSSIRHTDQFRSLCVYVKRDFSRDALVHPSSFPIRQNYREHEN